MIQPLKKFPPFTYQKPRLHLNYSNVILTRVPEIQSANRAKKPTSNYYGIYCAKQITANLWKMVNLDVFSIAPFAHW